MTGGEIGSRIAGKLEKTLVAVFGLSIHPIAHLRFFYGLSSAKSPQAPIPSAFVAYSMSIAHFYSAPVPEAGHDTKLLGSVFTRLEHPPGGCP